MKAIYIIIFSVLTFNVYGQDSIKISNLSSEIKRIKTETVLIVNSQAIDEYPLWSPNSDFIACNIEGKWYKFPLTKIKLDEAKWRGQTIGVLANKDRYLALTKSEQKRFEKVSKLNTRKATTKDGTTIELRETGGLSVSLIVTKKGEKPKTLWTSGGENCHSLVLSPDGQFVAYLCEMNGLLVMKIK